VIFVHNRDRGVYNVHDSALCGRIDREAERVGYQKKEYWIPSEAEQFLDTKLKDMTKVPQG
jgi:hypothetical protein